MQIGILINDKEYREALVERLSNYDNDLLVNIINGSESFSKNSLILTDIDPSTLDKNLLIKLKPRTLFLTASFSPNATDNVDTGEIILPKSFPSGLKMTQWHITNACLLPGRSYIERVIVYL